MSSTVSLIDLDNLPEFRPFPAVATRVMAACDDPEIEPGEIAKMVQCDATIAMRILSVANSFTYGHANEISTVEQAIVVMGFRAARNLVLSVAASAVFHDGLTAKQAKSRLWQHSLGCAAVARLVALQVGVSPDEAFLAAIVHDVGKLIFLDLAEQAYHAATHNIDSSQITLVEQDSFGTTHTELGQRYACEWGLPNEIVDAIAFHHEPEAATGHRKLAGVVCIANSLAISLGLGHEADPGENVSAAVERSLFQLDEQTLQQISEIALMEYEAVRKTCT